MLDFADRVGMTEKILIIDDDVDTLKLVGLMLQRQGYEISAATSGKQGIEKAAAEKPDVIVLDIMMPEMDGYEVARRLKKDPATRATPILMFTAKTQMDDKVAGFEVGADDYLTKPTHPAELQAHVRALLSRSLPAEPQDSARVPPGRHAHSIALVAARGGLGVSTLASNLAGALHMRTQAEVILAEFTPGTGTLGLDLGVPSPREFGDLLRGPAEAITGDKVNAMLSAHASGLRLLMASDTPRELSLMAQSQQYEAVYKRLDGLANFVVLDLGSGLAPFSEKILRLCQDRIVVTEGSPNAIAHTRLLLDEIEALGIAADGITVVLNNRVRAEGQMLWTEVQRHLAHPIGTTLTPAPEMMIAAARRRMPAVIVQPTNVTSQQILKLADQILEREKVA